MQGLEARVCVVLFQEEQLSKTWTYLPKPRDYERHYDRRTFDFGISVKAIVGVDLDFSPFEFADLVLGFFGLDTAGDDLGDEDIADEENASSDVNGVEAEAR